MTRRMDRPATVERIAAVERVIRTDPAQRGLLDPTLAPLGEGELHRAAASLAGATGPVLIATGFYIPASNPPAAETDGPPGAIALASVLARLGIPCLIVTDPFCESAVRAGVAASDLDSKILRIVASPGDLTRLVETASPPFSHVIAVERLGRGYDDNTIRRWGQETVKAFLERVPPEDRSHLLNMRGQPLDDWTIDFSSVFENPPPGCQTIGIADGGNEIGMGAFDWRELADRLPETSPPAILSAVPCHETILAGTSNWAALALAAATAHFRQHPEASAPVTPEHHMAIIDEMVQNGPAVDGVTGKATCTVDGLDAETYLRPITRMRSAVERWRQ